MRKGKGDTRQHLGQNKTSKTVTEFISNFHSPESQFFGFLRSVFSVCQSSPSFCFVIVQQLFEYVIFLFSFLCIVYYFLLSSCCIFLRMSSPYFCFYFLSCRLKSPRHNFCLFSKTFFKFFFFFSFLLF